MDEFETNLNSFLVETFNYILRFEEMSLRTISNTSVTVTEAHILEAIRKRGQNATVSEIAGAMNIAVPTATVAVKKLEKKGLVTKASSAEDGRKFLVGLTDMGKKIDKAHALFHKNMIRNISRNYSDTEKDILLSAVKKLHQFFKEKVKD